MASPLSIFRKYQFLFMVFLVLLALGSFVIAPSIQSWLDARNTSRRGGNEVVVTWNGGQLNADEIDKIRVGHRLALQFLSEVINETVQKGGVPQGVQQLPGGQFLPQGISPADSDREMVYMQMMADKATRLGIVVSDDAILDYLEQLTNDTLQRDEIGDVFRRTIGNRLPESWFFQQLRTELLAQKMRGMAMAGLFVPSANAIPPSDAWEYFKRLNHRVSAELVAIPVEEFVAQVKGEPSQSEIEEIFAEGKELYPFPDSPEPGFRIRQQINFQYVQADFESYQEEEKAKLLESITDAEIEKHYNDNKSKYRVKEEEGAEAGADGEGAAATGKEGEDAAPQGDDAEKPAEATPANEKPAEESSEGEQPAPEAGNESTEQPEKQENDNQPIPAADAPAESSSNQPAPDDNGLIAPAGEFFVSAQEENSSETPPQTEAGQADTGQADTGQADTGQADTGQADTGEAETGQADPEATEQPPAEGAPAKEGEQSPGEDAAKAADQPAPEESAEAQPGETQPAAEGAAEAGAATDAEAEAKIRPLDDELRQEIREELAEIQSREPAQKRLTAALEEVRKQVNTFVVKARQQRLNAKDDTGELFPEPLEIDQLELPEHVTAHETGLVDALSINEEIENEDGETGRKYEISSSFDFVMTPQFRRVDFAEQAFNDSPLYSPENIRGGGVKQTTYLYWKKKAVEERIPELDEVREDVVAHWKKQQALVIAEQQAEELLAEAKQAGKPLKEVFQDRYEVGETNQFSWMSTGFNAAAFGQPGLGSVVVRYPKKEDATAEKGEAEPEAEQADKSQDAAAEGDAEDADADESESEADAEIEEMTEFQPLANYGNEFMKAVFALKVGESGVAINRPKDVVYLVRIIDDSPNDETLKTLFLAGGITREMLFIANNDIITRAQNWYDDFEEEMGVEWKEEDEDLDG